MKTQEKNIFLNNFYKPKENFETNLLGKLKEEIKSSTSTLTSIKKNQVLKILKSARSSPEDYIKAFSPLSLVLGTPGGGITKRGNLILHPSWINHPSAFLLVIHEFEHLLYFTDSFFKGDHYVKMAFHYFFHPTSFKKRIEKRAIKRTRDFILKNYNLDRLKEIEKKLSQFSSQNTIYILKRAKILDKDKKLNLEKVFSISKNNELIAYRSFEKSLYDKRYLDMLKEALLKNHKTYMKNELDKYTPPLRKIFKEYFFKLLSWSLLLFLILKFYVQIQ